MAITGLTTPAANVMMVPCRASCRSATASTVGGFVFVSNRQVVVSVASESIDELHRLFRSMNRPRTLHDTVDGTQILTVSLAGHGGRAGSPRMKSPSSSVISIWRVRIIYKGFLRVRGISLIDSARNGCLKDICFR